MDRIDPPTPLDYSADLFMRALNLIDDAIGDGSLDWSMTQDDPHPTQRTREIWNALREEYIDIAQAMGRLFRGRPNNDIGIDAVNFWRTIWSNVDDAVRSEDIDDARVWRAEWQTRGYDLMISAANYVETGNP